VSLFGRRDEGEAPEAPGRTEGAAPQPGQSARSSKRPPDGGEDDVANIGKSIAIKGDLTGNEDLVIEGKVEGKVELPNNQLTIGANGVVQAEVHAKTVVVVGRVAGNVKGSERVEIQATGVVEGDVAAPRLTVAEGAVLNGAIHMTQKEGAAAAPPKPAAGEVRRAV
jgi:cytoskeletal protein CcmA (bactofilin family)